MIRGVIYMRFFNVSNRIRVMQKIDDIDKGGTQMDTPPVVYKQLR